MATSPRRHLLPRALALAAVLVIVPVGSASGAKLTRLNALGVGTFATYGAVRSSDGTLHLIYQTTAPGSAAPDGLATQSISPAGTVASPVQALTGWGTSVPALLQLPGGTLEAIFGAVAPQNISDIWGITSGDGGATWAAPVQVGSGAQDEALAYGANVTGSLAGSTPALTLSVAGGIVAQTGLGAGAPSLSLLTASDGFASDVDSALDASTDELVASWSSAATPGGDFIQGAAPTAGSDRSTCSSR